MSPGCSCRVSIIGPMHLSSIHILQSPGRLPPSVSGGTVDMLSCSIAPEARSGQIYVRKRGTCPGNRSLHTIASVVFAAISTKMNALMMECGSLVRSISQVTISFYGRHLVVCTIQFEYLLRTGRSSAGRTALSLTCGPSISSQVRIEPGKISWKRLNCLYSCSKVQVLISSE